MHGVLAMMVALMHLPVDTVPVFPVVEGSNLEGRSMTLPADFGGDLNVVLVAFQRDQQADVDTWTPALKTMASERPGLRVYELPTLGRRYRLIRGFIDGGMRSGIPDSTVRAATITLYIDKDSFKRPLGIESEDSIHVFLVERGGVIRWRGQGAYTPELGRQLSAAVGGQTAHP
ncbi:MAG: hypothetical protein ABIT20_07965 [Gemmatimonadaceae bacterium]